MTGAANVIPLLPYRAWRERVRAVEEATAAEIELREREVQAALDQAAADRGWAPDPWRLRKPRAKNHYSHAPSRNVTVNIVGHLRVVR